MSDGVVMEGSSRSAMWTTKTIRHPRAASDVTGTPDDVTLLIFSPVHGQSLQPITELGVF